MHSLFAARSNEEWFWDEIIPEPNSGCWLWVGYVNDEKGYGRVTKNGRGILAHRFSYELYVGNLQAELVIHHKCGLPLCVNPDHLQPMTQMENLYLRNINKKPLQLKIVRRTGVFPKVSSAKYRLIKRIKKSNDGCWNWQGATNGKYPVFDNGYAHRRSFEIFKGHIPTGLQIDHLCRNKLCVNPDHLEAVTCSENLLRVGGGRCRRGHLFDEENTWYEKNGARHCRKCHAMIEAARRLKFGRSRK